MAKARQSWSVARILKAVILTIAALLLAALVIRASALRALPTELGLAAAETLGADRSELDFQAAGQELLRTKGPISAPTLALVMDGARRQPLAGNPYMFAAIQALVDNDLARGEQLLIEARRRNPRLRDVRVALFAIFLETDRVDEATREMQVLLRLESGAEQLLLPVVARLAESPARRPALIRAIGAEPLMGNLLNHLTAQKASPELIMELAQRQPPVKDGVAPQWQSGLLDALISRGDIQRARALWARFAGVRESAPALLYDPRFEGRPGGAPFNWTLTSSSVGVAERAQGGALAVEFFGRMSGVLAEQLLTLSPGRYRLSFRAEGSANAQGSKLVWRVSCRGRDGALIELPLEGVTYTPKQIGGEFTVPGGCSAQTLQLAGVAAEFPVTQSARITDLVLERSGGGR